MPTDHVTLVQVIQWLASGVMAIGIPIVVYLNYRLTKLEEDSAAYKVRVAETYLKQDRFAHFENTMNEKLDRILDKLDTKADKH